MKLVEGVAYVTAKEMTAIDKAAIEEFGMGVESLMENAGRATAWQAKQMLGGAVEGRRVVCLVGKGNNGGDGLVAARYLHIQGAAVRIILSDRNGMGQVPSMQLQAVEEIGVTPEEPESEIGKADLVIDGLLGYGSKGDPREPIAEIIRKSNASGTKTLAVDIPSGLDATSGEPRDPCVVATSTLTFGFPKIGFLNPRSKPFLGDLYMADISFPLELYKRYTAAFPFASDSIVRIRQAGNAEPSSSKHP